MLTVDEAQQKLIAQANKLLAKKKLASFSIPLLKAADKILASDCHATINIPPADNSAMDGYAINTDDVTSLPVSLDVSQRIPAGQEPLPLLKGTAARIFTGAEIPEGANAVVIQENCEELNGTVTINEGVKEQGNIRPQGQDVKQGEAIAKTGDPLTPARLGLLASTGKANVNVFPTLKVALLSTGDELIQPGQFLKKGLIYNSNQYTLSALLKQVGVDIISVGHIPDDAEKTKKSLSETAQVVDLIITTGGVSVGEEDHLKDALAAIGSVDLWKVALKPGKPVTFGLIDSAGAQNQTNQTPLVGLPGNPTSAFITYLLFAKPFIETLQGKNYSIPKPFYEPIDFEISKPRRRNEYIRVQRGENGLEAYPNQSSGVLSSIAWADGVAIIPAGKTFTRGERLAYHPFESLTK